MIHKIYARLPLLVLLLVVMAMNTVGCTRSKKQSKVVPPHITKYLLDQTVPPLTIPQDINAVERANLYPVPGGVSSVEEFNENPNMPEALINPATGNIRIQSMSEQSWLLADIAASQIWPRLRSFISIHRLPVDTINVQKGEIVTKWLVPDGDLPREKYRIWIEPGLRGNTAEVHLIQATEPYFEDNRNKWPKVSVDAERAQVMLESIAGYLIDLRHEPIAISVAASRFKQEPRMSVLTAKNGLKEMVLDLGFDRAWAALSLALQKADILVLDLNRDAGIYYIAYKPETSSKKRAKSKKSKKKDGDGDILGEGKKKKRKKQAPKPGTAAIDKRAKDLARARLLMSSDKEQVVISIDADDIANSEASERATIVQELNSIIKRIATFIS